MKTFLRLCDTALEVKAAAGGDQVVTSVLLCVALLKRRLNQGRACKATLSLGWGLHRQQNTYILGPLINMRTLRNLFWGCDGWDHHLFSWDGLLFLVWDSFYQSVLWEAVSPLGTGLYSACWGVSTSHLWRVDVLLRSRRAGWLSGLSPPMLFWTTVPPIKVFLPTPLSDVSFTWRNHEKSFYWGTSKACL